jgi:hypothetical protein
MRQMRVRPQEELDERKHGLSRTARLTRYKKTARGCTPRGRSCEACSEDCTLTVRHMSGHGRLEFARAANSLHHLGVL